MKLLIKLIVAALVVNAAWHLGSAYAGYYWFTDAVTQLTQIGRGVSDEELRRGIMDAATQYKVALAEDAFSIRRDVANHIIVEGTYVQPVELAPRFRYPWRFTFHTDTFSVGPPAKRSELPQ